MNADLDTARDNFIQGMSRISDFWGFPKAMGAIYGAIYLSPEPLCLDDLVDLAGVSKGTVSTNVRSLERLGMVHKHLRLGDRKDYYLAEIDFWKVIKGILAEREKSEFDRALHAVDESMAMISDANLDSNDVERGAFYQERLRGMKSFFNTLDNLVGMLITLEDLRLRNLQSLFGKSKES